MPIGIATDQTLCLEALSEHVSARGDGVPAVFPDLASLAAALETQRFGLIVIDLSLEDCQPISGLRRLVILASPTPVAALDTRYNRRRRAEVIAAGFAGYLVKTMNRQMLSAGLDLVRAGLPYHVAEADGPAGAEGPPLTERQVQVLRLLGEGRSNSEIAEHLGITTPTVKLHVNQILKRLGARNRTEAAIAGLQLLG